MTWNSPSAGSMTAKPTEQFSSPLREKERPGMLVLTRKYGQKIMIGDDIVVTVLEARGDAIRVGIQAPAGVSVKRAEVYDAVSAENRAAATAGPGAEDSLRHTLGLLRTLAESPAAPASHPAT